MAGMLKLNRPNQLNRLKLNRLNRLDRLGFLGLQKVNRPNRLQSARAGRLTVGWPAKSAASKCWSCVKPKVTVGGIAAL